MPKVFISHSSKDSAFVEAEIVDVLRAHGIDYWYSKDEIGGGDQWVQTIINALKQCDWFLVVLSPRSVEAKYVRYEVSWAVDHLDNGRIVPVLQENCEPDKLHFAVPFIQHIDFRSGQDLRRARTDLLRRWGVAYSESGESRYVLPPTPLPSLPVRKSRVHPVALASAAVLAGSAVGLGLWWSRPGPRPVSLVNPSVATSPTPEIEAPATSSPVVTPVKLSTVEQGNRLVLATLPGLNGKWWFEEAPWLAPAFRAAALAAPAGAFEGELDVWGPEPAEVYNRLRNRLDPHIEPALARWGWLAPAKGAKAFDEEQLVKMEAKVATDSATFRAQDWHTLAAIRHHLTAKDDSYSAKADDAYRKALAAYDRQGEKRLKALCLSDHGLLLIDSNYDAQAISQIDLAEGEVRDLGPASLARAGIFRAYLRSLQASAYEVLFDWSSEGRCLDEARSLLDGLGPRATPHPLQASAIEQAAWMKMWRWDVEAASGLFGSARAMRAHSEGHNPVSYLEKLHDLHGEAMIQRFRGHSRRAQDALREILVDIDKKLVNPETQGDAIHVQNLLNRKFNSLERLADCDLFDGRPAAAIQALADALSFGRENSLFRGGDRSDEVRLLAKQALASALNHDQKGAESRIKKALDQIPKEEISTEGTPRVWVDTKGRFYARVIDAVVRLGGEGRQQARDDLREVLRTRDERLDRDGHELLMNAAELLIASDRLDPEADAAGNSEEDADLLFALLKAIPPESREALRTYLGRYHDTALGAKLGDESSEVGEALRKRALEAWFSARETPPTDKALLLLHFEGHMGHAVYCPPNGPARHYPLDMGRPAIGKAEGPRKLPPELAAALGGSTTLICWRPPSEAPETPFPFEPPPSARFEFQGIPKVAAD